MALMIALSLIMATSQGPADNPPTVAAPAGSPETRYCLRVDPLPGSHIETVRCKTREEWAELEIDVDQEWAQNGVKVIT